MSSRQPPGDLGHFLPFAKLTRAKLNELQDNDEKQAAKLSEHDDAFAGVAQDLETLKNLLEIKMNAIDDTLRVIRGRLNGSGR